MISIVRRKCGIPINDVFFSANPLSLPAKAPINFFIQAANPGPGFFPFKTQLIDLSETPAKLFSNLSSNTRYKIRRAEREGIAPTMTHTPSDGELSDFCEFFDAFATQKNLAPSNRNKLRALKEHKALIISTARDKNGETLVAHAYVCDQQVERARLLYSASHFRGSTNPEERNRVGRANRFLHWHEMENLKSYNYTHYDLGGIPMDQSDPEKNAIARFKSEFGGNHVVEFNGYLSANPLIQRCIPLIRRMFT